MTVVSKAAGVLATATIGGTLVGSGLSLLVARALWRNLGKTSYQFSDRTVVITGGSRGLGLAIARQFVSEGARVALLARNEEALDRARSILLRNDQADILALPCDVTDRSQVNAAVDRVRTDFGPIDVLINNAGLMAVGPLESMTVDDFRESLDLHFWAPLFTTLAVLPEMRQRRQGRIVNISSIGGKISIPHLLPYSAGKFALAGFSEGLRTEVLKDNIYVTSVYPGLMRTGSPRNADFKGQHRAEYAWFSVSDSLPGVSIGADRAARKILRACRSGRATLTISMPAKMAITLHQLFPRVSASALGIASRMLPDPGGIGTGSLKGKQSESWISPSWLTSLDEFAARENNELAG